MTEREKLIGLGLLTLLLVSWFAFLVHVDPRFAGSIHGGLVGFAAAALMLSTFVYVAVKRVGPIKRAVTRVFPLRSILTFHIYAGVLGAILALIHTGHKFESPLGVTLIATMLAVVLSGFIGRYFMTYVSEESREKRISLSQLEQRYREVLVDLSSDPERQRMVGALARNPFLAWLPNAGPDLRLAKEAHALSESIADLEYAIKSHSVLKRIFGRWITIHIVLSVVFLLLLAAHIWSEFYFGIRWFR